MADQQWLNSRERAERDNPPAVGYFLGLVASYDGSCSPKALMIKLALGAFDAC